MVRHLRTLGHSCRRLSALQDALPALECATDSDHYTRLVTLLTKEKARPTKSKGLAGKVKSWFPRLTEDEQLALVQRLFKESRVSESQKVLTYNL